VDVAKTQLRSGLCRDSFADALEFQNPLLDYEDGILRVGWAGQEEVSISRRKALRGDVR
jgi:hypothetical protein